MLEDARGWSKNPAPTGTIAPTGAERVDTLQPYLSKSENAIYEASVTSWSFANYRAFEDYRAGWHLDAEGNASLNPPWLGRDVTRDWWLRRSVGTAQYQVVKRGTKTTIDLPPATTWADVDRDCVDRKLPTEARIVFVQAGRLYAAAVSRSGLGAIELLFDFNPLRFEQIEAPY